MTVVPFFSCFNPRAPCGARQNLYTHDTEDMQFQSTRPVWGATIHEIGLYDLVAVSIHAPRVGRDALKRKHGGAIYVSIHAPRVGRDE